MKSVEKIEKLFNQRIYKNILGAFPIPGEHLVCCMAETLNQEVKELMLYQKQHGEIISTNELETFQKSLIRALIDAYAEYMGVADMDATDENMEHICAYLLRCPDNYTERAKSFRNFFPSNYNHNDGNNDANF